MEETDHCEIHCNGREVNKLDRIRDVKLENNSQVKIYMKKPNLSDLIYPQEEVLPIRSTKFETIPSYEKIARMNEIEIATVPNFTI